CTFLGVLSATDHMASTKVLLQLVVEFIIVFFGLVGNAFIVHVNLLDYWTRSTLQPSELIVTILALFNIFIQLNLTFWFIIYLFNLCAYFGDEVYKVTDFLAIFFSKASYWFTAWLCFVYCVKIIKVNWRFFMRVKKRLNPLVNSLIIGTVLASFAMSFPVVYFIEFKTNSTSISKKCKDYYVDGRNIEIYAASLSFLTSFVPLAVMVFSSMGIIIFLCRHSWNMSKNVSSGASSHGDAHTAVAVMLICLIVLYVACTATVLAANLIIAIIESDILIAISFTSSIYSAGSSIIIIIGTVKLRQSCRKL
uniref:Taste receptor type 2 n=1 Tax=Latimeria chalumnae TaxID=7897 RepID=H3A809_LATCH